MVVELMESRLLLSQSIPAGSYIFWDRLPNLVAGQKDTIVAEVKGPDFRRVLADSNTVQFTVVSAPGLVSGAVLATATFRNGVAIVHGLTFKSSGLYGLSASSPNVQSTQSGFTVSPARPAALEMNGFANYLHDNTGVQFEIEVVDKFGNMVATDRSRMTLGPATPKGAKVHIVPFDSQGNPFSGALVRHGQQFGYAVQVQVNGFAFFDLTATGVTGTATVKILDSNPAVGPITSPAVPAL